MLGMNPTDGPVLSLLRQTSKNLPKNGNDTSAEPTSEYDLDNDEASEKFAAYRPDNSTDRFWPRLQALFCQSTLVVLDGTAFGMAFQLLLNHGNVSSEQADGRIAPMAVDASRAYWLAALLHGVGAWGNGAHWQPWSLQGVQWTGIPFALAASFAYSDYEYGNQSASDIDSTASVGRAQVFLLAMVAIGSAAATIRSCLAACQHPVTGANLWGPLVAGFKGLTGIVLLLGGLMVGTGVVLPNSASLSVGTWTHVAAQAQTGSAAGGIVATLVAVAMYHTIAIKTEWSPARVTGLWCLIVGGLFALFASLSGFGLHDLAQNRWMSLACQSGHEQGHYAGNETDNDAQPGLDLTVDAASSNGTGIPATSPLACGPLLDSGLRQLGPAAWAWGIETKVEPGVWLALLHAVPGILSGAIVCALEQQFESVVRAMRASHSARGAFSDRAKLIRLYSMLQSGREAGLNSLLAVFLGSVCAAGTGPTRAGLASACAHDLPDRPRTNSVKSNNRCEQCTSDHDSCRQGHGGALGCPLLSPVERYNYGAAGAAAPRQKARVPSCGHPQQRSANTVHPNFEQGGSSAFSGVQPVAENSVRDRSGATTKALAVSCTNEQHALDALDADASGSMSSICQQSEQCQSNAMNWISVVSWRWPAITDLFVVIAAYALAGRLMLVLPRLIPSAWILIIALQCIVYAHECLGLGMVTTSASHWTVGLATYAWPGVTTAGIVVLSIVWGPAYGFALALAACALHSQAAQSHAAAYSIVSQSLPPVCDARGSRSDGHVWHGANRRGVPAVPSWYGSSYGSLSALEQATSRRYSQEPVAVPLTDADSEAATDSTGVGLPLLAQHALRTSPVLRSIQDARMRAVSLPVLPDVGSVIRAFSQLEGDLHMAGASNQLMGPFRRMFLALDVSRIGRAGMNQLALQVIADWMVEAARRRVFVALVGCSSALEYALYEASLATQLVEPDASKEGASHDVPQKRSSSRPRRRRNHHHAGSSRRLSDNPDSRALGSGVRRLGILNGDELLVGEEIFWGSSSKNQSNSAAQSHEKEVSNDAMDLALGVGASASKASGLGDGASASKASGFGRKASGDASTHRYDTIAVVATGSGLGSTDSDSEDSGCSSEDSYNPREGVEGKELAPGFPGMLILPPAVQEEEEEDTGDDTPLTIAEHGNGYNESDSAQQRHDHQPMSLYSPLVPLRGVAAAIARSAIQPHGDQSSPRKASLDAANPVSIPVGDLRRVRQQSNSTPDLTSLSKEPNFAAGGELTATPPPHRSASARDLDSGFCFGELAPPEAFGGSSQQLSHSMSYTRKNPLSGVNMKRKGATYVLSEYERRSASQSSVVSDRGAPESGGAWAPQELEAPSSQPSDIALAMQGYQERGEVYAGPAQSWMGPRHCTRKDRSQALQPGLPRAGRTGSALGTRSTVGGSATVAEASPQDSMASAPGSIGGPSMRTRLEMAYARGVSGYSSLRFYLHTMLDLRTIACPAELDGSGGGQQSMEDKRSRRRRRRRKMTRKGAPAGAQAAGSMVVRGREVSLGTARPITGWDSMEKAVSFLRLALVISFEDAQARASAVQTTQ